VGRGLSRNQRIAFREGASERDAARLRRAWARHLARLAVDCTRLARLAPEELARRVELAALPELRALLAEGRGLIGVSGHIGVWEVLAHLPRLAAIPLTVVARPRASPALEAWLCALRRRGGARVLPQRGALRPLARALRRGEAVGLLCDEDAPRGAVFAPFLGTPAATSPAAAWLQRASGAPIAVVACHRSGAARWRVELWGVIRRAPAADAETELRRTTGALNEALSRAILARPEQWLWSSRRFATRPPGERPGSDGLPPRAPDPERV
jgi:KDO2-lipid IV(A) lauroyltransferase